VRIGSAVEGVVLVVVWPVTGRVVVWPVNGLAGGVVPSRAPGKCGGSTQGPAFGAGAGLGTPCGATAAEPLVGAARHATGKPPGVVGARREAAGRGTFFRVEFQWGAAVDERAGPLDGGTAQSLQGKSHESPALADGGAGVGRQEVNEA
jgi:hypothetical protein